MLSVSARMHLLVCENSLDGVLVLGSVLSGTQIVPWSQHFGNQMVGMPKFIGLTIIEFIGRSNSSLFADGVSIQGAFSFRGHGSEIWFGNRARLREGMNAVFGCKIMLDNDLYWGGVCSCDE